MTAGQRDLIDQIGRILVVVVLVYVTMFGLGYLLAMFQMSIHPLIGFLISIAIVGGILAIYYRHPEKSFF